MKKFQQTILDVLGHLSRLWKGLEDIKNAPGDTILVPIEDHIKLNEQTVLLLGQASNSILYSRRLQILETLIKDPKKVLKKKNLKEKAVYFKKTIKVFLAKSSDRNLLKHSKKIILEVFYGGSRSAPPLAKKLFWTGPLPNNNKPYGVSDKQSSGSKPGSFVQKIS